MKAKIIIPILLLFQINFVNGQKVLSDLFEGEIEEFVINNDSSLILFHYKVTNTQSIAFGLELYFLKIPLNSVSIQIKDIDKNGDPNTIYKNAVTSETIALVSGGFWGYNNLRKEMPIGLVVSKGKILSAKNNWKAGGVLYQKSDEIKIEHIAQIKQTGIEEALQSRPILVYDGRNAINTDNGICFDRMCIGITYSHELIICGIFNKIGRAVSLYEFAEILVNKENSKRPNVFIALAMDGGPSSHLFFPSLDLNLGYDGINYVPNIIEIIKKK